MNPALLVVSSWMSNNGLSLAPEKSECVVLTKKRAYRPPEFVVNGYPVPVRRTIRYIGVHLGTRLFLVEHARTVAAGARKAAVALGSFLPNVGGSTQPKRQLLTSVVHSRLLYGAQVWADGIVNTEIARSFMTQAQRCAALRVAHCHRSVSDMAALLLARMPPAPLLALERKSYAESRKSGSPHAKPELWREVIREWQTLWEATSKASWTKRLIPDVARWWYNSPQSVSYHMSQALTGHGCFQAYLWERARAPSPVCVHCSAPNDIAEHTIFLCPYWDETSQELSRSLGKPPRPEDVADLLCIPDKDELPSDRNQRKRVLEKEFWPVQNDG